MPLTLYPLSTKERQTHEAMNPVAPVTRHSGGCGAILMPIFTRTQTSELWFAGTFNGLRLNAHRDSYWRARALDEQVRRTWGRGEKEAPL